MDLRKLKEWLQEERTIQELKNMAKQLDLPVKKQMKKQEVRKLIERYIERAEIAVRSDVSSSLPSSGTFQEVKEQPKKEDISLPQTYQKDKLVMMPINPYWYYLYWDFSPSNSTFVQTIGRIVLRVYDVTFIEFDGTNAHRTFEIPLSHGVRNYYINLPMPGAHYLAEIGYYDESGQYRSLLRSNLCRGLVNSPSQSTRERWLDLRKHRRIVVPSVGMLTQIVERVPGSVQGIESLFRISSVSSGNLWFTSFISGKGI